MFPATRQSLIERIRSDQADIREPAAEVLVRGYWQPVFTYLRLKWKRNREDAEDLTQGFFATALEKGYFAAFNPTKGRFRTFLRTCLDRYAQHEAESAGRLKRGGGAPHLSLDFETAEGGLARLDPADPVDTDEFFRREMIRALFAGTVEDIRRSFEESGRDRWFAVFERYDLGPDDDLSYAAVAREMGLTAAQVTNYLFAARKAFRERALERLRELSGTDEEFRAEARALFGIDVE